jgi:rod shape-determining protein MreC
LPDFKHRRSYKLFAYKSATGLKLLFFVALSLALMTLDHHYHNLETVRTGLSALVYPLRAVASFPYQAGSEIRKDLSFRSTLLKRNGKLERQSLKLHARLQQMKTLRRENTHLRALMNTAAKTESQVRIGRIMSVALDPFRQQIVINKGTSDGTYVGQPLLGAKGIMGQITHVGPLTSTALLITDPNSAVPVEVARNDLRTIALGTGDSNRLKLPYLPNNADIRVGDTLVTSGLGGRFPRGYPVATVTRVDQQSGAAFAEIAAEPTAGLGRSHQVLLLWPPDRQNQAKDKRVAETGGATP